ncbi:GNAT family N-acetyltransferase [uncultured Shimia sp.]|uniref:GNAT family N-acetyltransferase n=1 Tax=uncultured Shimia sp. TaxID=573152 RepID=UPI0025FDA06B|nr:GNAT family N-acetyltransferase [uncultured Shimia sp.]
MIIRKFASRDTDSVLDVWAQANALAHPFLPDDVVAQVAKDMRAIYLPNAETWVLEVDDTPMGFIAMIDTEIGGLFVAPSSHGRGYGRALVDHVVAKKGPLTVEVFAANASGRPFYERYGFEQIGEDHFGATGDVVLKLAMPKATD